MSEARGEPTIYSFGDFVPELNMTLDVQGDGVFIPTTLGERWVATDQRYLTALWQRTFPMTEKFPYCYDGMTDWLAISRAMNMDDVSAEFVRVVAVTAGGVEVGSDAYEPQGYNPNAASIIEFNRITRFQKGKGFSPNMLDQLGLIDLGIQLVMYKQWGKSERTGSLITPTSMHFVSPVIVARAHEKLAFEVNRFQLREDLRLSGVAVVGAPISITDQGLANLNAMRNFAEESVLNI